MSFRRAQGGYVLLLVLLALMGVGGVVLAGFTQQARQEQEAQRYEHNRRVLQEAKQALLMYAYDYPDIALPNARGPGRLPCPDRDNDGTPDPDIGQNDCLVAGNEVVGRFPWNANGMDFYEARDASGEQLWYAVSGTFSYDDTDAINSSARNEGTITVFDQSGAILYDGSATGIAAVIIAPGPVNRRDEDNNGSYEYVQSRATAIQRNDPRNYLDTLGGFDNARFVNGSAADADGFMLGPVFDPAEGDIVVNDQMVIVTADEVVSMAEKAVLEAYRDAVRDYLAFTGNVYPWLYNYAGVTNVTGLRSYFPADSNFAGLGNEQQTYLNPGNIGRIPSIFRQYFTETDSQSIESKLSGSVTMNFPLPPAAVSTSNGPQLFNGGSVTIDFQTSDRLTGVRFEDIADILGSDGRLTGTIPAPQSFAEVIYFWDHDEIPPTGIWTPCPDDGDGVSELSDCHRDAAGNPTPGGSNDNREEILRVVLRFDFSGSVEFDVDYSTPPTITLGAAASGAGHATIEAGFSGASVVGMPVMTAEWEYDDHYHEGDSFTVVSSGTESTSDLILSSLTLGMRFYPELPYWVVRNDWHDSIRMAYASDYLPDTLAGPCTPGTDCLEILNIGNPLDNKASLLIIAGEHGWNNEAGPDLEDDPADVFDIDNDDLDTSFDARAVGGNDKLLVIEDI